MNAKGKGTRAEHEAMKMLEQMGYICTRAAASLGDWDIVAIPKSGQPNGFSRPLLVQVKCNRWPCGSELANYMRAARSVIARCEIWMRKDGAGARPVEWMKRDLNDWREPVGVKL